MATHIDALHLRKVWGREDWLPPLPFGPDGWRMFSRDRQSSVIVSCCDLHGREWIHASIAHETTMPTYDELAVLHNSVWKGRGYACQVFAPTAQHVNIHQHALHLWGQLNGEPVLPEFALGGSI